MTRDEKVKQVLSLENEISELKCFMRILENEHVISKRNRYSNPFIKKTTTISFLGFMFKEKRTDKPIPDKMVIEIAAKCQKWIEELDRRANELIESDK